MSVITTYLNSCRELARFCSHNGWIDSHSLHYTILLETDNEVFVEVEFDELLMEASGRIGGRVACCGQLHLYLNDSGHVTRADVL